MTMPLRSRYAGHRFPPEIISPAIWLYFRFPLSLRMVEEMLAARGVLVSHATVRQWALKFGQAFANQIRRRLPRAGDKWHLDEVVILSAKSGRVRRRAARGSWHGVVHPASGPPARHSSRPRCRLAGALSSPSQYSDFGAYRTRAQLARACPPPRPACCSAPATRDRSSAPAQRLAPRTPHVGGNSRSDGRPLRGRREPSRDKACNPTG